MRFITSLVATAACLAPVRADFWLFLNFYLTGDETGSVETWYEFFASDPSCSDVDNAPIFTDSEDLSHDGDVGVRCEGCNLANADPTEVEIKGSNGWWSKFHLPFSRHDYRRQSS